MIFTYIFLFAASALLLLISAIALIRMFRRDLGRGIRLQNRLAREVRSLRLGKMLRRRDIDPDSYLLLQPASRIAEHIGNCRACDDVDRCDAALARPPQPGESYDYCPNADSLSALQRRRRSRSGEGH